jgi:hypothetical protein
MANTPAVNNAPAPTYNIDQILQATQPKQPGGFRRVLGALVGGVGNIFAPGLGGIIGGSIGGGLLSGGVSVGLGGGLGSDTMQYLQLERQMQAEQEAFETASAVLKSRHESSMAAIRAIN